MHKEEGRIRLGSHLGDTASPSLPIKFSQPQRLSGASRQTTLQAGGGKEPQAAPGFHLPCKGSCTQGQEGFQLPASSLAGLQLPLSKALHQLGGRRGQDAGLFLTRHFLIDLEDWSTRLSASPSLLAVPEPSVDLETFP